MKFYVVTDRHGATFDCVLSLATAKRIGREQCDGEYDVDVVTTPKPSRELVRLLLAEHGGYATDSVRVIESGKPYRSESDVEEQAETEARERAT